jgi:hypothetical protein
MSPKSCGLVATFIASSIATSPRRTSDYALGRSCWQEQHPPVPTEADGETLCRLVLDRLPADLREIDGGGDPEALRTNRTPKFLRP